MSSSLLQDNVIFRHEAFKRGFTEKGATLRAIHFNSPESQRIRFEVLMSIGDIDGCTLLDIGCGFGDLYGFLQNGVARPRKYLGIDIVEEMLKEAHQRYPRAKFKRLDILQDLINGYDYVVASGLFGLNFSGWSLYVQAMLKRMLNICNIGVGVNFLSRMTQGHLMPAAYYADPMAILSMALKLSPKITLRHDYRSNDFTIYIYK